MKYRLALLLTILTMAGANPSHAVDPVSFDDYKNTVGKIDWKAHEITFEQYKKECQNPAVVVLDLRSEAEYKEGHLKGARLMGADIREEKLKKLVPNKQAKIIVYCTNTFYPSRRISLNNVCLPQFIALGYPNVFVIEDIWQKDFNRVEKLKQSSLWEKSEPAK